MKENSIILLCVDLEGFASVTGEIGKSLSDSKDLCFAAREAVRTINITAQAIFDTGNYDVWIWDNHGTGLNLDYTAIDERCSIISGQGEPARMSFVSPNTAGAFLLGYHSRGGNPKGVLAHSYSSISYQEISVNGEAVGEIFCDAHILGEKGIPVMGVVSDDEGCREAERISEAPHNVITKFALARNMCRTRPRREIDDDLRQMVSKSLPDASGRTPLKTQESYTLRIKYQRSDLAAQRVKTDPRFSLVDPYTVETVVKSLSFVF